MAVLQRIPVAITAYLLLITIMIITESTARELRPSDHGLEYQALPPEPQKSPEMMSFFGTTSSSSSSENVALPRAMNSNETSWWGGSSSHRSGGGGSDHVRHVLLVGSVVCGVTGAALLAASAFVYLFRYQKQRSLSSCNNGIVNPSANTKSLVISK